jgi:hypothetical protein
LDYFPVIDGLRISQINLSELNQDILHKIRVFIAEQTGINRRLSDSREARRLVSLKRMREERVERDEKVNKMMSRE